MSEQKVEVTEKAKNPLRPNRLDLTDLPRDKNRVLGGLRGALCASFNYCRRFPAKMEVLKETLTYILGRIETWEVQDAEARKLLAAKAAETEMQRKKVALDEKAKLEGITLDRRKSLEDMVKDYKAAVQVTTQKAAAPTAAPTTTGDNK